MYCTRLSQKLFLDHLHVFPFTLWKKLTAAFLPMMTVVYGAGRGMPLVYHQFKRELTYSALTFKLSCVFG